MSWKYKNSILLFLGIVVAFIVLAPTLQNGWINYDDPAYVLDNHFIGSLSLSNIWSVFSAPEINGAYHPITILSLALNFAWDGNNVQSYHLTNLVLHLANMMLVYLFICGISKHHFIALCCCVLFAIYPTQVEPVAWISSRKDVLYGFFFLVGLNIYLKISLLEGRSYQMGIILVFLIYLLSLLSKPMAVSFPCMLVLIDYYRGNYAWHKRLLEKVPFFLVGITFILYGIYTQKSGGASTLR